MMKAGLGLTAAVAVGLGIVWMTAPGAFVCLERKLGLGGPYSGPVNDTSPRRRTVQTSSDGIKVIQNIQYGSLYPNSWLDVYQTPNATSAPTYLYVHGGGFAWGDKAPSGADDTVKCLRRICRSGYHVVSVNYALTPRYRYPVPLQQLDQAVAFLIREQEILGLDMSRVVLGGGSAGGQLVGQYANLVTNSAYATQMQICPALDKKALRGVVFGCALLQPAKFDHTGDLFMDLLFSPLKRCYFGADAAVWKKADVVEHLTEDFPPAYITDGNHGTFEVQAKRLDQLMTTLGIRHECYFMPTTGERVSHGYDCFLNNPAAEKNLERIVAFLRTLESGGNKDVDHYTAGC